MKKLLFILLLSFSASSVKTQEINAEVQVNYSQIDGSNTQVFNTLEKSLKDFINNTSWTGRKLNDYEKVRANFAIIITQRQGLNSFKGSVIVQASRPVFGTQYETPIINLNDSHFAFEYIENENITFNERYFSGKNLTDVITFYVFTILGYDADSFAQNSGEEWFKKAQKIAQNSQNKNFEGWEPTGNMKSRSVLINEILDERNLPLREVFYTYHRLGLDNLHLQNQIPVKQTIESELLKLKVYENNFQFNFPLNLFIDTKKDEIFQIFENNNGINTNELKLMMKTFAPKEADSKWNKWK